MRAHPTVKILIPGGVPGGVADHAKILSQKLGLSVVVAEVTPMSVSQMNFDRSDVVLLSCSGYGYHKNGAPFWLADWAKKIAVSVNLFGTLFHELYATGPPWRKAFWFSPLQKAVVQKLATVSDFIITNSELSWRWLRQAGGDKPHLVLPVFSNVGEGRAQNALRTPVAVVFGGAHLRARLYQRAGPGLFSWAESSKLAIYDVGPPLDQQTYRLISRHEVHVKGSLPPDDVRSILAVAKWGLIDYKPDELAKSSTFAAYAANGVCPVVFFRGRSLMTADGLKENVHYLSAKLLKSENQHAHAVAEAAHDWYQSHDVDSSCHRIRSLISIALESKTRV